MLHLRYPQYAPANSKGDSYFVNNQNKITDDMQKGYNSDTENESKVNPERLSNIELEERSHSSSFNCLTPAGSNQVAVNKYEDHFEQLDSRKNKELVRPKTVLEKNGPYDNYLYRDVKFLREEISSKIIS